MNIPSGTLITFTSLVGVAAFSVARKITALRSGQRSSAKASKAIDIEALNESGAFKLFHVIPLRFSGHPMIALLVDRGLFDFNELRNTLMLPVDQELANKMQISVYSDDPLLAYTNGISAQLERFWNSTEGVAARAGDSSAIEHIAKETYRFAATVRAGLINGDVFVDVKEM
ncbi:hypothetical protein U8P80_30985 (plasmid) [Rhizobium beringeri]|nr:hypothetical protein U8P80_30985 [Rhizobium beringeri]WSH17586.1 hypothetical protein U8P74_30985 [Rhizobium beringeri]